MGILHRWLEQDRGMRQDNSAMCSKVQLDLWGGGGSPVSATKCSKASLFPVATSAPSCLPACPCSSKVFKVCMQMNNRATTINGTTRNMQVYALCEQNSNQGCKKAVISVLTCTHHNQCCFHSIAVQFLPNNAFSMFYMSYISYITICATYGNLHLFQ